MHTKWFFLTVGISGGAAVALGAIASHALQSSFNAKQLDTWQTASQYQMYHTLALLGVALMLMHIPNAAYAAWAGYFFLGGIILFSGSLYMYSLTGIKTLAMITPFGGLAFIVGWILLSIAGLKAYSS